MLMLRKSKGLLGLLYCTTAVGLATPAQAQQMPHDPLILDTAWYRQGAFPYAINTLPKKNWLGFAYNPPNANAWNRVPCKIALTTISIKREEVGEQQTEIVTYAVANSGTPKPRYLGYLIHGVALRPGPVDCAQVKTHFAEVAIPTNDPSLGENPRALAAYRLGNYIVHILANRVDGKTRLIMQYQGQSQVLIESRSRQHLEMLKVNVIADLDRDGKPDAIVSEASSGTENVGSHVKLYLSGKAAAGQLVGEAASY